MPLSHGVTTLFDIIDLPPRHGVYLAVAIPSDLGETVLPAAALPESGRLAAGRGLTRVQARASTTGEAAELASAVLWGDERLTVARLADLGPQALHPNRLMPVSDAQLRDRDKLRAQGFPIPAPFNETALIPWAELTDACGGPSVLVPAACVYLGAGDPKDDAAAIWADSTGCAAGPSRDAALVAGFLELVERDATALWWYGRHPRAAAEPGTAGALHARLAERPGRLALLDLTTDLAIPVIAAVSVDPDRGLAALGVAARFDPGEAAVLALTEMVQVEAALAIRAAPRKDDALTAWLAHVATQDMPFLRPDPTLGRPEHFAAGVVPTVETCVTICRDHGLCLLFADLTRADMGQSVMRAIVPGLRGLSPWFGPGRLYDVPTALGWPGAPRAEGEMNTLPLRI